MPIQDHSGIPGQKSMFKWKLTVTDSFSLKALYVLIHDFFVQEEYFDLVTGKDNFETRYTQKKNPDGSMDYIIWFRGVYQPSEGNKYAKYYAKVDINADQLNQVEEMVNGQKIKLEKGRVVIAFENFLELDVGEQWKNDKLLNRFQDFFWRRISGQHMKKYKDDLADFSSSLRDAITENVGMTTSDVHAWAPVKGIDD